MKKINLKNFPMDEVLTKNDLRKIVGGNGSGGQNWLCYCPGQGTWGVTTYDQGEINDMWDNIDATCSWGGGCSMM